MSLCTALQGTNVYSPDAATLLTTQLDGNLVLYNTNLFNVYPNGAPAALWASGTYGLNSGPALYPTFVVQPVRIHTPLSCSRHENAQ